MKKPKAITTLQSTMVVGTTIIGVGILAFPRITVEYARTGAPVTTFFAVLVMMGWGLLISYLGNQYPEETIFEYPDRLVGKWVQRVLLIALGLNYLMLASLAAREFGEVVVTSVLQRTPLPVTVLTMIGMAAMVVRSDIAVFSRILTFYMPFVYFPAIVIVVLSLKSAQFTNIQPVFAFFSVVPMSHLAMATLVVMALFQNYIVIGLLLPFMYRPKDVWKSTLIGIGSAGALYLVLLYSTLSVFGIEEMKRLLWPTLELAKTAALPAASVERLDPVFLAVWVTAVFSAIYAAYFVSVQAFSHVMQFQDHRVLSFALLPFIFVISRLPPNIFALYKVIKVMGFSGLSISLGYPLLLLIVHVIRRAQTHKKRSRRAKAT